MPEFHVNDHDRGLQHDMGVLLSRRLALTLVGSAGAAGLVAACGDGTAFGRPQKDLMAVGPGGIECVGHPEETAGPFPGDGSNLAHGRTANVLVDSGIVRRDMRASLAPSRGIASGTPIELTLSLVDVGRSCAPLPGYAVYVWHCDAEGRYSLYDLADQSYLRAVGVSNAEGKVEFTTIFPGCYPGRYPHLHFEVYANLAKTANYRNRLLISQLALPADAARETYAGAAAYRASIAAFARTALDRDGVFRDNTPKQRAAQTIQLDGNPQLGFKGRVVIGLAA